MNKTIIACMLSLGCMSAMAQGTGRLEQGYVVDSSNHAVRSSDGNCVRTGTFDPSTAYHPECTPAPIAVAPTPIMQPQEQPAPIVAQASHELTIHFAFDSALISAGEAAKIDDFITQNGTKGNLTIVAGTDFIGSNAYNQRLSNRRAQAIAAYLNHKYSTNENQLNIVKEEGVGKSEANLQNTDECKALMHNRRKLISCIAADRFGTITIVAPQ